MLSPYRLQCQQPPPPDFGPSNNLPFHQWLPNAHLKVAIDWKRAAAPAGIVPSTLTLMGGGIPPLLPEITKQFLSPLISWITSAVIRVCVRIKWWWWWCGYRFAPLTWPRGGTEPVPLLWWLNKGGEERGSHKGHLSPRHHHSKLKANQNTRVRNIRLRLGIWIWFTL